MKVAQRWASWLAIGLAVATFGCDDPCVELAKKICTCELTEREQRACTQRVEDDAASREATQKEQDRCADLVDECTCGALKAGNLAACGLTND